MLRQRKLGCCTAKLPFKREFSSLYMGLHRIYRDLLLLGALLMEDAIRQAIADLSALIKDADSKDAERIREIIERLLKDPLIFRQCIHLRDIAVLLNRGSYVEQYD